MAKYQLVMDQMDEVMDVIVERVKLVLDNPEKLKEIAIKNLENMDNQQVWHWYIDIFDEEKEKWELYFENTRKSQEQALNLAMDMDYFYEVKDLARLLRVSENVIIKKINNQEIMAEKMGCSYRISQREVNRLVSEIAIKRRIFEEYIGVLPKNINQKDTILSRLNHYLHLSTMTQTQEDLRSILIRLEKELGMMIDQV